MGGAREQIIFLSICHEVDYNLFMNFSFEVETNYSLILTLLLAIYKMLFILEEQASSQDVIYVAPANFNSITFQIQHIFLIEFLLRDLFSLH